MAEWYNTPIKGIPKSEEIAVRHCREDNTIKYIITVDRFKNYKLYFYKNGQAVYSKHKANNPLKLEEFIEEEVIE